MVVKKTFLAFVFVRILKFSVMLISRNDSMQRICARLKWQDTGLRMLH